MNTKALVLVPILATGIALGYLLLEPERNNEPQQRAATPPQPDSGISPEGPISSGGLAAAVQEITVERVDHLIDRGFIPPQYRDLWLDPDYRRIAEERFNVIPKVAQDGDEACVPLDFDTETICWNEYGYHPYLTYDVDELRQMAGTDAAAAEALVFRLPRENRRERMHYALEASRLSDKSGPIMRFAYSFTPDASSPRYFDQMLDRYAIAVAGESLGYPYRLSRELEIQIRREFDLSVEEFRDALRGRRVTMQQEWGDPS